MPFLATRHLAFLERNTILEKSDGEGGQRDPFVRPAQDVLEEVRDEYLKRSGSGRYLLLG